jgi:hypothetical protein
MNGRVLRTIRKRRSDGHLRIIYIMQCDCGREIRLRKSEYDQGIRRKCMSCKGRKRPYESVYNGLCKQRRFDEMIAAQTMTYDEYLTFVNSPCFYCQQPIPWRPFSTDRGQYVSRAYYLDRKDHAGPYSVENCVPCCTRCNRFRMDLFSFEEFCSFIPVLRSIEEQRNRHPDDTRGGQPLEAASYDYAIRQEGVVFEESEERCVGGACGV